VPERSRPNTALEEQKRVGTNQGLVERESSVRPSPIN
jgi:hypothetical protein